MKQAYRYIGCCRARLYAHVCFLTLSMWSNREGRYLWQLYDPVVWMFTAAYYTTYCCSIHRIVRYIHYHLSNFETPNLTVQSKLSCHHFKVKEKKTKKKESLMSFSLSVCILCMALSAREKRADGFHHVQMVQYKLYI